MSNKSGASSSVSGGVGFFSLLGLLFIGLKLAGVVDWPWLWVLSPLWGQCLCVIGVLAIVLPLVVWLRK